MKKISVVGIVGLPAAYGGFESLVENLTRFAEVGMSYHVFCSSKQHSSDLKTHNGASLEYIPLKANGVQSILYDIVSIFKSIKAKPDVVLILGVSGAIAIPLLKSFTRSKIITNIDGLEWKREKWGKLARLFLKFSESFAVRYSDVVITDNQAISEYVMKEYTRTSTVIAYGGDHALLTDVDIDVNNEQPFYLTICRIEPENNIHLVLEAFAGSVERIKFVGNWSSSSYGRSLVDEFGRYSNIELIEPIYDINKLYKLRMACKGYIHGHSAGGTNPSLVEAMHFAKPVYAFDCNFNRYTTENQALYFKDGMSLRKLLNVPLLDTEKMALAMKEIASRRYMWEIITRQYESLY
ncbi:DUF1972 domain-containing protein [Kosakonia sp. H02]|nr:DUF1972 domain-containing protein [Kosakonia sp. H02]